MKWYEFLKQDEKQQVVNGFNEKYGGCLDKAERIIRRVASQYRERKDNWAVIWHHIQFSPSKNQRYLIPFDEYVSIFKRVRRHRANMRYSMENDPAWGVKMIALCAESPTNSVTISDECNGELAYSGEALFNIRKEVSMGK